MQPADAQRVFGSDNYAVSVQRGLCIFILFGWFLGNLSRQPATSEGLHMQGKGAGGATRPQVLFQNTRTYIRSQLSEPLPS